jgi:hypothetical protein
VQEKRTEIDRLKSQLEKVTRELQEKGKEVDSLQLALDNE